MRTRYLASFVAVSVFSFIALAQRATRPETKPAAPATTTHSDAATAPTPAEHSATPPSHSTTSAARFQRVATALRLNGHQQKSIANLVQSAREQLTDIRSNSSLTPEQRLQARQRVDSTLAQKFVGLLTPQQKKDLEALLLKQQNAQKSNANAQANSGSGASVPDVPTIDAPSSSGSEDSASSSSSSSSSSTDNSKSDSVSSNGVATAATTGNGTGGAGVLAVPASQASVPNLPVAPAKQGHLSDAQLAAILNSFVQDEGGEPDAKPGVHSGAGSGS